MIWPIKREVEGNAHLDTFVGSGCTIRDVFRRRGVKKLRCPISVVRSGGMFAESNAVSRDDILEAPAGT